MQTIHHGIGLSGECVVDGRIGVDGQTDLDNISYVAIRIALHQSDEHGIPSHVGADLVGIGETEGHLRFNRVVGTGKLINRTIITHTCQVFVRLRANDETTLTLYRRTQRHTSTCYSYEAKVDVRVCIDLSLCISIWTC